MNPGIGKNKKFLTAWAEIDLKALRHNLNAVRRHAHKSEVLAVVKADAYGHGMGAVARELFKEGVRFFGVASLEEALALRHVLKSPRILVLGSFHRSQVSFYQKNLITPTISSPEDAVVFAKGLKGKKPYPVHVKIDTGMGRLGYWHEHSDSFFEKLKTINKIKVDGIYTHFANADHPEKARTKTQLAHFNGAVAAARTAGLLPRYIHAANSMGLVHFKSAHFNLVRPGILLYGICPDGGAFASKLKPVMSLKARISFIKPVDAGRAVSYGSTYRTKQPTKIATVAIGYSHGYRVGFSNRAPVLINGQRFKISGRVTMDQILVDVGRKNVERWQTVTLLGREANQIIKAEELAKLVVSIPYEITCAISQRVPRVYIS